MRPSGRKPEEIRDVSIETGILPDSEGSCLIKFGNTHVLCVASVDERVPPFLRNKGSGWVTAEYGMLPRSTHQRMNREAKQGKQSGRTQEIQRLIARSLRSVVDLKALGERQIIVDCDVIRADGGTRTASITGGFVALSLALQTLQNKGLLAAGPAIIQDNVAAISCGICSNTPVVDLDYREDSSAEVDANFVLTGSAKIVEIQGTAEESPFSEEQFSEMLGLAKKAVNDLVAAQNDAIKAA